MKKSKVEMQEPVIVIPYGDWVEEYRAEEADVSSEDAVIKLHMEHGYLPAKMARLLIVASEREETEEGILPPPKSLLNTGGAVQVSQMYARRKRKGTTPSGREYMVRELVAPVREESDDGQEEFEENKFFEQAVDFVGPVPDGSPMMVWVDDPKASERALLYLERHVAGEIWDRLLIIAVNGGDVENAAQMLKDKIDEMVEKLVKPHDV